MYRAYVERQADLPKLVGQLISDQNRIYICAFSTEEGCGWISAGKAAADKADQNTAYDALQIWQKS